MPGCGSLCVTILFLCCEGDAMLEIAEVHRQIELQRGDVVRQCWLLSVS